MNTKKILSKIENANLEGVKSTTNIIKEFIQTACVIVVFLLFCEWANCFPVRTYELVFIIFLAIYLLALLIYKHIVQKKFLKEQPKASYSSKLFNRLIYLYLIISVVLSTIVECILVSSMTKGKVLLFAIAVFAMNYFTEGIYHYWGTLFYNSKAFIAILVLVTFANFAILHFTFAGVLLLLGIIIVLYIISLFAPKGIGIGTDGFGRVTYFYYF